MDMHGSKFDTKCIALYDAPAGYSCSPAVPMHLSDKNLHNAAPRTSGADDCTLVPPSWVTQVAMVACAGRIFMPLMSPGTVIFLVLEWNEPGSCTKARQNLTSFISVAAYLRYQASIACVSSGKRVWLARARTT